MGHLVFKCHYRVYVASFTQKEVMLRYIQSLEERQNIMLACHIDLTSGHMGKTRTLCRIKE